MADSEKDYFVLGGADIRLAANGYYVTPGRYFHRGECFEAEQTYVFATIADLAVWLKARYKAHG